MFQTSLTVCIFLRNVVETNDTYYLSHWDVSGMFRQDIISFSLSTFIIKRKHLTFPW